MDLTFTARYTDGRHKFEGLDQYYGAQSLLGLSQILLITLNAYFNKEIITQAPSARGFRVVLGTSKKGSWDQLLHLVITDPNVLKIAEDMSKSVLYDLLKWGLVSGAGIPFVLRYRKAKKIARELERQNEDLQEKLDEALKRVHAPIKHQGLTVHVMAGRTNLATFNEATLRYIETEIIEDDTEKVVGAISRFNARTGTGRIISTVDATSIPFYPVDKLSPASMRTLADSLASLARDQFVPVEAMVSRVTSADGHLKSYRLHTAWRP